MQADDRLFASNADPDEKQPGLTWTQPPEETDPDADPDEDDPEITWTCGHGSDEPDVDPDEVKA